jgi:hypothetical protein
MKIQKKILTGFLLCLVAAAVAAAISVRQIRRVEAARSGEMNFGIVSLNAGQTLRFNVVNPNNSATRRFRFAFDVYSLGGPDTFSRLPDDGGAVAVCTNNLRVAHRQTCEITLLPGEAFSTDFPAATAETRVNAVMLGGPDTIGDPNLLPTLEIRENNRTVFIHPGAARSFNPQPDPPDAN